MQRLRPPRQVQARLRRRAGLAFDTRSSGTTGVRRWPALEHSLHPSYSREDGQREGRRGFPRVGRLWKVDSRSALQDSHLSNLCYVIATTSRGSGEPGAGNGRGGRIVPLAPGDGCDVRVRGGPVPGPAGLRARRDPHAGGPGSSQTPRSILEERRADLACLRASRPRCTPPMAWACLVSPHPHAGARAFGVTEGVDSARGETLPVSIDRSPDRLQSLGPRGAPVRTIPSTTRY